MTHPFRILGFAALLVAAPAAAQQPQPSGQSCAPPLKFAAGACVQRCPAGYDDRGSVCVYRSLSGSDH